MCDSRRHYGILTIGGLITLLNVGVMVDLNFRSSNVISTMESEQETYQFDMHQYEKKIGLYRTMDSKLRHYKVDERQKIADTILLMAKIKNIPIELILGLIEVESNWNLSVTGGKAIGAMQITPIAASKHLKSPRKSSLLDPITNIVAGCSHLAYLHELYLASGLEKENEFNFTLFSYNTGKIIRKARSIKFTSYVKKVNAATKRYSTLINPQLN